MTTHSHALRRRWADPAYHERQTATNRRTGEARRAYFADPAQRALLGQAVRRTKRRKRGRDE